MKGILKMHDFSRRIIWLIFVSVSLQLSAYGEDKKADDLEANDNQVLADANICSSKTCYDNNVWCRDERGERTKLFDQCIENFVCEDENCVCEFGYELRDGVCIRMEMPEYEKRCVGTDVYHFSNTGKKGTLYLSCGVHGICRNAMCVGCQSGYFMKTGRCVIDNPGNRQRLESKQDKPKGFPRDAFGIFNIECSKGDDNREVSGESIFDVVLQDGKLDVTPSGEDVFGDNTTIKRAIKSIFENFHPEALPPGEDGEFHGKITCCYNLCRMNECQLMFDNQHTCQEPCIYDDRSSISFPESTSTDITSNKKVCPDGMVYIPPGKFMMGCSAGDSECDDDEKPAKQVSIAKGFCMDMTEVTQESFQKVIGNDPSFFRLSTCGYDCPVDSVTWNGNGAKTFCEKQCKRLPTEAEWEYAARGGSATKYFWGDNMDGRYSWYRDNASKSTHSVGQKMANSYGLYDMGGNVSEWVEDCYDSGWYAKMSSDKPQNTNTGCDIRVLRGGSWDSLNRNLRVSNRHADSVVKGLSYVGFRCAQDF